MSFAARKSAWVAALALSACVVAPVWGQDKPADKPGDPKPIVAEAKSIDLVICLDVSGSMKGLIDSAKLRLWDVVNELARMKPTPNLRVGLYSYGAIRYAPSTGWVRKDADLTEDLDDVYKALNSLQIGGGTEYVARVTKTAITDQKWSTDKDALKIIFVCGNEPADQDKQVHLDDVASLAKQSGVIVNTVYCKYGHDQEIPGWANFSAKCGGKHVDVDMNKAVRQIAVKTEFDEQIIKLGEDLNKTYVAYGKDGKDKALNQVAQDTNAAKAPGAPGAGQAAAVARTESKAGALYRNSTWDLVDRMKEKDFDLTRIKEEELCDELKKLKPDERVAYLKKKAEERVGLQKKIADLSAKRQKKVDEEIAKIPKTDSDKAVDDAFKTVIRDQAKIKGFETSGEKK